MNPRYADIRRREREAQARRDRLHWCLIVGVIVLGLAIVVFAQGAG